MRLTFWGGLLPVLGVEDLERSTRFYATLLGFRLIRSGQPGPGTPAYRQFRHSGADLLVYELDRDNVSMQDRAARKKMMLYVPMPDVATVHAELCERRAPVSALRAGLWGCYCDVEDPDGYLFRFGASPDPTPSRATPIPD